MENLIFDNKNPSLPKMKIEQNPQFFDYKKFTFSEAI